jgi:hypothetical protein
MSTERRPIRQRPQAGACIAFVLLCAIVGCAARQPAAPLRAPTPEPGKVLVTAKAEEAIGGTQPIGVAVTNGLDAAVRVDPTQVFAHAADAHDGAPTDGRVLPVVPAEAARLAGSHGWPGAARGAAVGAAGGGLLGAIGGAIAGAIQGGIGLAVAAGTAVGATIGAITGGVGSGEDVPDVAAFEVRALHDTTLAAGGSTSGFVYFPAGRYDRVEVLLRDEDGRPFSPATLPLD